MKMTRTQIGRMARAGLSFGVAAGLTLAAISPALVMNGCEEKKKAAPPPPPPPPPPAPPAPDPIQVDPVLQSMKPDARVQFPQSAAPYSEDLARAIITLANDFAKGDATSVRKHLAPSDQSTLDNLVGSGEWEEAAKKIEGIRVVSVSQASPDATSANIGLAFQEQGTAYVVGFSGGKSGSEWVFAGASAPTETKPRASDFDGASIGGFYSPPPTPAASAGGTAKSGGGQAGSSGTPTPDAKPGEPAPAQPNEDQPEKPKPRKKMTPSGPVNIPGGG